MTPEELEALAKVIGDLRSDSLFSAALDAHAFSPEAEQYYLLALNALEAAQRYAQLAGYMTRQGR